MKTVKLAPPAIDTSFMEVPAVVYVVSRHHGHKRFLSRSAAINNLANFMVDETFRRSGWPTNEPDQPVMRDGFLVHLRGDRTREYYSAHQRCTRRIRRLLAKKRDIQKWHEKHEELKQQYADHLNHKPF